jgi:hypothetical protein
VRQLAAAGVAVVILLFARGVLAASAFSPDGIWFCPSPGSIDYIRLFEHPEEWPHVRRIVSVFKFYAGHTQTPPHPNVGANSYSALVGVDAFRQLNRWGKKIAIEVGAVKEFYCTPDSSGMDAAIADTLASVKAVEAAGGTVAYLAMDEPFASGRAAVCGGPALEPTADRVAHYTAAIRAARPAVRLGLIEAYPFSREDAIERMLDLLQARNAKPAFLHIDIDLNAIRQFRVDLPGDLRRLKSACASARIPFGVIIWGYNGDADALYALDAGRLLDAVTEAFPSSRDLPDHIIFQSWAVSRTGQSITPSNLPESTPYTHTNLLWSFYRRLVGETGSAAGTAISR